MNVFLKIVSFCFGCLLICVIAIASNSLWFDKYIHYFPSAFRYGDLYLQTNMPGYRVKELKVKPIITDINQSTTLTLIGDSYAQPFDSSYFSSGTYRFIHWNALPDTIPFLDSNKRNIIILESTERAVRLRFLINKLLTSGKKTVVKKEAEIKLLAENNLQFLLTYFDWQLPLKELKTRIYLNWFDRFSPMITKPDGSGRLYLRETVDPKNQISSFNPASDTEIKKLIQNLNLIKEGLYKTGFNEVYISIIPNPSSLYINSADLSYNHLIERLQNDSSATFKTIDVYEDFKKETIPVFRFNDSHWNELGKMIWLIKVNALINASAQSHNRK